MIERWYIGFTGDYPERARQWFDVFTCKEFRHCLVIGYDAAADTWVSYETCVTGTVIRLYPGGSFDIAAIIAHVKTHGRWLAFTPREALFYTGCWRLYCVPAVKFLVGLKSCALRPKALYRDLVKAGAVPAFIKEDHGTAKTPQDAQAPQSDSAGDARAA